MARVEFYIGSEPGCLSIVNDGAVPRQGELVNIRKVTYRVHRVTWNVDYDGELDPRLRANVEMVVPL
jgi:hypothetical protein